MMGAIAHWSVDPLYLEVFWDSFLATLILPFKHETYLSAVFSTPVRDNATAMIFGIWGSVCGAVSTIILTMLILRLLRLVFGFLGSEKDQKRLQTGSRFYNRWLVWSSFFFGWGVYGSLLPLFSGIFRGNLLLIVPLCVIGKMVYYFIFYVQAMM